MLLFLGCGSELGVEKFGTNWLKNYSSVTNYYLWDNSSYKNDDSIENEDLCWFNVKLGERER